MDSLLPAAAFRNVASWGTRCPFSFRHPDSAGFITPTLNPASLNAAARPQATRVLPTPVSVPVMKKPRLMKLP